LKQTIPLKRFIITFNTREEVAFDLFTFLSNIFELKYSLKIIDKTFSADDIFSQIILKFDITTEHLHVLLQIKDSKLKLMKKIRHTTRIW